jgi:dihydrofolate synthase / folylpolyglutamate synthase
MSVGLAFDYFVNEEVDIAIVEVGLGGRLDSTNIITPLISVITNIGLDHTQFLGNTLSKIAYEKAGIIKANIPVVIGEYTNDTKEVFLAKAKECNAGIFFASDLIEKVYPSDLLGDYQVSNIKTVMQTIDILNSQNQFLISDKNLKKGLLNVVKNTGLLGRWQQINANPKVICDTAHNSHGLKVVLQQIKKEKFKKLFFVLGFVDDKDLADILPLFPKNANYFFCKPNNQRGLEQYLLQQKAQEFGLIGDIYDSVTTAYHSALAEASENDFIYIGGSTFVVAEIV